MQSDFEKIVAPHRGELKAHCYRMSGSLHEAEDLLQEALIRAWKGFAAFEGRSSVRTWLYKVTTNVCLDALEKKRRHLPSDLAPANGEMAPPRPEGGFGPLAPAGRAPHEPIWLEPCPEDVWTATPSSPEARYDAKESVALAFLTALQHLPPKQRAVLILRDVIGLEASECAELLDTSVAGINSALQRARETLEAPREKATADDGAVRSLLAKYVKAWEQTDVGALVALLREDATLQMPPIPTWIRGAKAIGDSIGAMVFVPGAAFRLVPTRANGRPAFLAYAQGKPMAIHVIDVVGDRIAAVTAFGDPSLFAAFQPSP